MTIIQMTAFWIAMSAGLISIGHHADQWLDSEARQRMSDSIRTKLVRDWTHWARTVSNAFLSVFDAIYRVRNRELDRALWQSVLFCYAMLAIARVVLKVSDIPVPRTSSILGVAISVAVGGTLFVQAFRNGGELFVRYRLESMRTWDVIRSRQFRAVVLYGSPAIFIYTATAIVASYGMGVSGRTVTALSFGAAIGVPTMLAITLIPDRVLPVSPLRALGSSLLALTLLAIYMPTAFEIFLNDLQREHWNVASLILFNLFADMVSLVETRWVLVQSARQSILRSIFLLLVIDLILSAAIFFILPGIADQHLDVLLQGIIFKGPLSWTGILFWSTFATSALFYLFVGAVLLLKLLMPVFAAVQALNKWFPIYDHPVRLVSIGMVAIVTVGYGISLLIYW